MVVSLSASTLDTTISFYSHGSCLSVYDFVSSRAIAYHCDWYLEFFFDEFYVFATILWEFVIFCYSSEDFAIKFPCFTRTLYVLTWKHEVRLCQKGVRSVICMRLTSNSETLIYKLRIYNNNQKVSNGIWLNKVVLYYIPIRTTGSVLLWKVYIK